MTLLLCPSNWPECCTLTAWLVLLFSLPRGVLVNLRSVTTSGFFLLSSLSDLSGDINLRLAVPACTSTVAVCLLTNFPFSPSRDRINISGLNFEPWCHEQPKVWNLFGLCFKLTEPFCPGKMLLQIMQK